MSAVEVIGDSARGDEYASVRLTVDGDRVVSADAPGLARPLDGLTLLEAAAVPGERLPADALANALAQVFHAAPDPTRVAVAMSGGVDSAVALLRARPNAVGVTLRLWLDPKGPSAERACCSPQAVIAARETCHALGIPHITLDLREEFHAAVVEPFVDGYADGTTPNPCTHSNGAFRFDALLEFAERAGAAMLWTGHYARIVERDPRRLIARAADPTKDQSYMLATLPPERLHRIAFPLGDQTKEETREEARAAGLAVARRPESQEACFLAGGDYRVFLERNGVAARPGPIVDADGHELGRHAGLWRYTLGQRRGLGVGGGAEPLYAISTRRESNALVVGPRSSLACTRVRVRGALYLDVVEADVKLRYRSEPVRATVVADANGFVLHLHEPAYAVAPGQTAALYDDGAVVGAGVIEMADAPARSPATPTVA
jgi:tRNA-specific 2-thiouridylase